MTTGQDEVRNDHERPRIESQDYVLWLRVGVLLLYLAVHVSVSQSTGDEADVRAGIDPVLLSDLRRSSAGVRRLEKGDAQ